MSNDTGLMSQDLETKRFFEAWALYQKVIANNWMDHREVYAVVGRSLQGYFTGRALTVADLGCGDASLMARVLAEHEVTAYAGFDLSAPALALARENLATLECPVGLEATDLLTGLQAADQRFDLIFSGYAFHHLREERRAAFFETSQEHLAPDGLLVVLDWVRAEEETRTEGVERYLNRIGSTWAGLLPEEFAGIQGHVRECDLPASPEELVAVAQAHQLALKRPPYQTGFHAVLIFERPA